jgi:TBC1 domain family member 10
LHEGIPFLMRVSLALLIASRQQLLENKSEAALSAVLKRPTLPSSADALVAAAVNLKLKDDDIRKQRVKMEQQVKKQQSQQVQSRGTISLPR